MSIVLLPQNRYTDALDVIEIQAELCLLEPDAEWDWRPEILRLSAMLEQALAQAKPADALANESELAARLERVKAQIESALSH